MKKIKLLLLCISIVVCSFSQGVTLLYKGGGHGWNDPANWIQLNTPSGQTPVQRAPTELDDVVFSKAVSGLDQAGFAIDYTDSLEVGSKKTTGNRCRSMTISGVDVQFYKQGDYATTIHVYTSVGGSVLIDSGGTISSGLLELHGGDSSVYDLEITGSKYGNLFTHAVWSSIILRPKGRAKFLNSNIETWEVSSYPSGGEVYAENCTFMTPRFVLSDSAKATILDCRINDGNNFVTTEFGIGRGSKLTSRNVEVKAMTELTFYSSGLVFNGNLTTEVPQSGLRFAQADPERPLPNIINGNIRAFCTGLNLSGGLKLSGDLINTAVEQDMYPDSSHVFINGQHNLKIGGIANFGNEISTSNCTKPGCHFKLEFFGDKNSNVVWPVGFPADTLVINKSNCAKVTFQNPLYVSGETRIQSGQLALDPNDTIPFKFVCAGDVTISKGGGLFLRRNSAGVAAMITGGALKDENPTTDTTCAGFSNPYNGTVALYSSLHNPGTGPITILKADSVGNLFLMGNNFVLGNNLSVHTLRFAGQATLALGNFTLTVTDSISGYGPTAFVVTDGSGKLQINNIGNRETVFPVGPSAGSYNPLFITNTGTPDHFLVSVQEGVRSGGSSGTEILDKAVNKTWFVEEAIPGGSNATMKVQWNAADETANFSRSAAYLSHFSAAGWDNSAPQAAAGPGPYTVSRSGLKSFSPFAVFSSVVNAVTAPGNDLLHLYPNPAAERLFIRLPLRFVSTTVQIFDSKGILVKAMQASPGSTLLTINTSDLPAGLYTVLFTQRNQKQTLRFIKQ